MHTGVDLVDVRAFGRQQHAKVRVNVANHLFAEISARDARLIRHDRDA